MIDPPRQFQLSPRGVPFWSLEEQAKDREVPRRHVAHGECCRDNRDVEDCQTSSALLSPTIDQTSQEGSAFRTDDRLAPKLFGEQDELSAIWTCGLPDDFALILPGVTTCRAKLARWPNAHDLDVLVRVHGAPAHARAGKLLRAAQVSAYQVVTGDVVFGEEF